MTINYICDGRLLGQSFLLLHIKSIVGTTDRNLHKVSIFTLFQRILSFCSKRVSILYN